MWFDKIKQFYNSKLWTKDMVADGVLYSKIAAGEYKLITGEDYIG